MTIQEVKRRKYELKEDIRRLLDNFTDMTSVTVKHVEVTTSTYELITSSTNSVKYKVNLEGVV